MAQVEKAGVIAVAAAGNEGSDNDEVIVTPAGLCTKLPNVVSVAATSVGDTLASYSNYGRQGVIIAAPGGDVAIITHGGVICIYLTHLLRMHVDDLWSFSLPNASITTVVLDFKPRLRSFGETAHLDASALGLDGMPAPL